MIQSTIPIDPNRISVRAWTIEVAGHHRADRRQRLLLGDRAELRLEGDAELAERALGRQLAAGAGRGRRAGRCRATPRARRRRPGEADGGRRGRRADGERRGSTRRRPGLADAPGDWRRRTGTEAGRGRTGGRGVGAGGARGGAASAASLVRISMNPSPVLVTVAS